MHVAIYLCLFVSAAVAAVASTLCLRKAGPSWSQEAVSWPFKPRSVGSPPYGAVMFPGAGSITAAVRSVLWGDLVPGDSVLLI